MKRFASLVALSTLLVASRADAVALFAGGSSVQVHEDYVLLHHDEPASRVHVLYAARLAPAFARTLIGWPTPSSPQIEALNGVDMPRLLHSLVTPSLLRDKKRGPVAPAPWITGGAVLSGLSVNRDSAENPFAVDWSKPYLDKGFFIAGLEVQTSTDQRVEVPTPTGHISYGAERLVLPRREPPLSAKEDESTADASKPAQPFDVKVDPIEPSKVGLANETVALALSKPTKPLVGCYEKFLEQSPGESAAMSFDITVRPSGKVVTIRAAVQAADLAGKALRNCVEALLQDRKLPAASEGYRFAAQVSFTPPRTLSRRTHVLALGNARYAWKNLPEGVELVEDFEVAPQDVAQAIDTKVRQALGIRDKERLWLSHWVDRSVRRTMADDVEFVRQDLPKPGEPGTLPVVDENKLPLDVHGWPISTKKPSAQGQKRPMRRTAAALGGVAIVIALALLIARNEAR